MEQLFCAWWNLENLFDVENSPNRSDKLQRAVGKRIWLVGLEIYLS